jgi:hypothetical protein
MSWDNMILCIAHSIIVVRESLNTKSIISGN